MSEQSGSDAGSHAESSPKKAKETKEEVEDSRLALPKPWRPPKQLRPLDPRLQKHPFGKSSRMVKESWLRRTWSGSTLKNDIDKSPFTDTSASFSSKRDTVPLTDLPPGPKVSYHKNVEYPKYNKDRYTELFGAEVDQQTLDFKRLISTEVEAPPSDVVHTIPTPAFARDLTRQLALGIGALYGQNGYITHVCHPDDLQLKSRFGALQPWIGHSCGKLQNHLAETFYAEDLPPIENHFKRARKLLGPQKNIREYDLLLDVDAEKRSKVVFRTVQAIRPPTPPPPPPPPPPTEDEWNEAQAKGPQKMNIQKLLDETPRPGVLRLPARQGADMRPFSPFQEKERNWLSQALASAPESRAKFS